MSEACTESSSRSRSRPSTRVTPSWRKSSMTRAPSTSSPPRTPGSTVVHENKDECVLCGLCLDASPEGAVTVTKLYDGTTLER